MALEKLFLPQKIRQGKSLLSLDSLKRVGFFFLQCLWASCFDMEKPEAAVVPRVEGESVLLVWCLPSSEPHWYLMLHLPPPLHTFTGAV